MFIKAVLFSWAGLAVCAWAGLAYEQRMNPVCHKCGHSLRSRRIGFWGCGAVCSRHGPFLVDESQFSGLEGYFQEGR